MECGSKSRRWPMSQSSPCAEVLLAPYDGHTMRWSDVFCLFVSGGAGEVEEAGGG